VPRLQDDLLDSLEEGILHPLSGGRISFGVSHSGSIKGVKYAPPSCLPNRLNTPLEATNVVSRQQELSSIAPQEGNVENAGDSEAKVLEV